jgi:hypothetical protein
VNYYYNHLPRLVHPVYEVAGKASPVFVKGSNARKKKRVPPPPMLVPDRKGNLRTVYMVGEPLPVHDPLVVSNIAPAVTVSPRGYSLSPSRLDNHVIFPSIVRHPGHPLNYSMVASPVPIRRKLFEKTASVGISFDENAHM